jgi:HIV Tat-specific factor 1
MKHMFTLEELKEDPAALLDITQEVREECEQWGEVTNVVLYDKEPEGIITVRFMTPEAAAECVRKTNGRAFDGRTVVAYISTGREKFKKSQHTGPMTEEEEKEEEERLKKYGEWLENH